MGSSKPSARTPVKGSKRYNNVVALATCLTALPDAVQDEILAELISVATSPGTPLNSLDKTVRSFSHVSLLSIFFLFERAY